MAEGIVKETDKLACFLLFSLFHSTVKGTCRASLTGRDQKKKARQPIRIVSNESRNALEDTTVSALRGLYRILRQCRLGLLLMNVPFHDALKGFNTAFTFLVIL